MKLIKLFFSAFLFLLFYSCGKHRTETVKETSLVSDSLIKNVQTAPAVTEDEGDVIKLNGKIQPDENKQGKVFALVSGKIQSVNVELGDYVKKGKVLAVLKSAEVAGVTNGLSLAQSDVAMAKKSLETTKDLYEGKLATEQDYINAKITFNKAQSELNKARQISSITGGNRSSYLVTAPLSGYIIEKNITNNSEVRSDNATALFAIADLSTVWIMANVYEADLNNIHLNDAVEVNTLANPNKNYIGKIDKIYNVLDPTTRTMKVRISMNNPGNELKPEMFATIMVNGKPSTKMLSIPSQALVMDNSKNYVVMKANNKLQIREITLIKRVDNKAYISGLSEGDQVVTNSQLFLYQALNTQ